MQRRRDDDLGIEIWARWSWYFILQWRPYGPRETTKTPKIEALQYPIRRTGIATILRLNTDAYTVPIRDFAVC